jgi:hypothetical protein
MLGMAGRMEQPTSDFLLYLEPFLLLYVYLSDSPWFLLLLQFPLNMDVHNY